MVGYLKNGLSRAKEALGVFEKGRDMGISVDMRSSRPVPQSLDPLLILML